MGRHSELFLREEHDILDVAFEEENLNVSQVGFSGNRKESVSVVRVHKLGDHRFHLKRYGRCPYCMVGSRPVMRSVVVDGL